jgi:small-conductance mechanosensitive channel
MCDEDFDPSRCVSVPNPFGNRVGRRVTIGLAYSDIDFFKRIGDEIGLPAEHIMEIYLRNIVHTDYKIHIDIPPLQAGSVPAVVGDTL